MFWGVLYVGTGPNLAPVCPRGRTKKTNQVMLEGNESFRWLLGRQKCSTVSPVDQARGASHRFKPQEKGPGPSGPWTILLGETIWGEVVSWVFANKIGSVKYGILWRILLGQYETC